MSIINITDDSFENDVINADKPVLLDFWAEWCGPCKALAPILAETAPDYTDKVIFAKINIDENPNTPTKFGVRGIPTLILFVNGQPKETKVGALTKSQLTAFIDESMS